MNRAIDDETFPELLKYFTMKITDVEDCPPEVIKVDDKVFGTLGNFSIITGKLKSGKTFNVSAIAAAAICGRKVLNYTVTLPADRKTVLYIDTEQARPHCRTVIRRIYKMAGMTHQDKSNLMFCPLRELNDVMRIAFIEKCLKEFPTIGLVIIDGIRDLLKDINSQTESNLVVNKLMEWTAYYDNHIVGVLHQNKNDDNTRGALGTETNNKAESTMLTSLVVNSNTLRFKVSCEMSRLRLSSSIWMPIICHRWMSNMEQSKKERLHLTTSRHPSTELPLMQPLPIGASLHTAVLYRLWSMVTGVSVSNVDAPGWSACRR